MLKIFFKNKSIAEQRRQLLFTLEKIVNIAVVKTERNENETVKQILDELDMIFRQFWNLKKTNFSKFEGLLLAEDFYEKYVSPLNLAEIKSNDSQTINAEQLKKEASWELTLDSRRSMKTLTQFLDSFEMIWFSAFKYQNTEISRFIVYHLNWLLAALVQEPNNELFVKQFLKLHTTITWKFIKSSESNKDYDSSIYPASIHWYTDIIFNDLGKSDSRFHLSYLKLFDEYLFANLKTIIKENQTHLFNSFVSTIHEGIQLPSYIEGDLYSYFHILLNSNSTRYIELDTEFKINDSITLLKSEKDDISSLEELEKWLQKFDKLKLIIEPYLDLSLHAEANKAEDEIREFAVSLYKFQNLLEMVFAICAFCIFTKKYLYIKYIWDFKQPSDSITSWVGHDIYPISLENAIRFYYKKGFYDIKMDFGEDHHGSEIYYRKYFLLLLARYLQHFRHDSYGKYQQIENYQLPEFNIYRLNNISNSVDELKQISALIKDDKDLLRELGFDITKSDDLFNNIILQFLDKLKSEADKQISKKQISTKISEVKISEFKKEFLESFYKIASLRELFSNYLSAFEDNTAEVMKEKKNRFGINRVDQKAAFFDDWHVEYNRWGEHYGRELAISENYSLLNDIISNCGVIQPNEFDTTIGKIKNAANVFIIATSLSVGRYFDKSTRFKPVWRKDSNTLPYKCFSGWYDFENISIPIFSLPHNNIGKQILILNKERLGKLHQLTPLGNEDKKELVENIFFMSFRTFSDDVQLMDKIIKEPPEWLKNIGDEGKQREHLNERILINIFERFEFRKHENFEGYKMSINP